MVVQRMRREHLSARIARRANRRQRVYLQLFDPLQEYTDDQCYERFRFDKESIQYLIDLLRPALQRPTGHGRALPVRIQVTTALRYYATGTFQNMIGDYARISKASVCRIIRDVSFALARRMNEFIRFPADLLPVKERFREIANIPGIIGAIDCSHVRIVRPHANQLVYINRKGYHSINFQAICDADRRFMSILAKFPGSAHDSRIFTQSAICQDFENGRIGGILLGDAGYACKPYLLTPYDHPRNHQQGRFNRRHAQTRVRIEQAFGCLKRRFHVLHGEIRLPDPTKICAVIAACCVLHNIAIERRQLDFMDVIDDRSGNVEDPDVQEQRTGPLIRDQIARQLMRP